MSTLFALAVKQAFITFERENAPTFKANFLKLKQLVDQLTIKDLNIDSRLTKSSYFQSIPDRAPVTYLDIFEHETFTMSVFIMDKDYTMPLHDHPGYGLLRILSGMVRVQCYSYDPVRKDAALLLPNYHRPLISVIKEPAKIISKSTDCSVLEPFKCNIHEITTLGDEPAAFFDVLSPPYESEVSFYGSKKCLFYRRVDNKSKSADNSPISLTASARFPLASASQSTPDIQSTAVTENTDENIAYLEEITVPHYYYCDRAYYEAPDFLRNTSLLGLAEADNKT